MWYANLSNKNFRVVHNMRKLVLISAFSFFTLPAFALLSPFQQSVIELKTLLDSPDLTQNLPSTEWIKDIRRLENSFILVTTNHRMVVDVIYLPRQGPGPQKFKLYFNPAEPLEEELKS